jgi:hypothetical protein
MRILRRYYQYYNTLEEVEATMFNCKMHPVFLGGNVREKTTQVRSMLLVRLCLPALCSISGTDASNLLSQLLAAFGSC